MFKRLLPIIAALIVAGCSSSSGPYAEVERLAETICPVLQSGDSVKAGKHFGKVAAEYRDDLEDLAMMARLDGFKSCEAKVKTDVPEDSDHFEAVLSLVTKKGTMRSHLMFEKSKGEYKLTMARNER